MLRAGVAIGILVLALAVALARRERAYEPPLARMPASAFPPGERAALTAFYFASRLCAECKRTPDVVRRAGDLPLVALWIHERPDLARELGVQETPTLLLADSAGRIRYARAGNPEPAELALYVEEARLSGRA